MNLLERRRLILDLVNGGGEEPTSSVEGVGADGQVVFTAWAAGATTPGASLSEDYALSFDNAITESVNSYYPLRKGVGKAFIPNLAIDQKGWNGSQVYLVAAPSGSVMEINRGISIYSYDFLDNTLTPIKRIGLRSGSTWVLPTDAVGKISGSAIAVAPEFSKILVAFNTCSVAVDFTSTHPWSGTGENAVRSWLTNGSNYTATTAYRVDYPVAINNAGMTAVSGSTVGIDLRTSKDANLTYCIVGSWYYGSASYSRDGAKTWTNLTSVLTSAASNDSQRYQSSEISRNGKKAIIATEKGLFFSNNYLKSFTFKSYASVGITDIHLQNSGSVYRFISLAASSDLKTIYLVGERTLGTSNTSATGRSGSVWVSTDGGNSFVKKDNWSGSYPASNYVACSATGEYAMVRYNQGAYHRITTDFGQTWSQNLFISENTSVIPTQRDQGSFTTYYREYPEFTSHSVLTTVSENFEENKKKLVNVLGSIAEHVINEHDSRYENLLEGGFTWVSSSLKVKTIGCEEWLSSSVGVTVEEGSQTYASGNFNVANVHIISVPWKVESGSRVGSWTEFGTASIIFSPAVYDRYYSYDTNSGEVETYVGKTQLTASSGGSYTPGWLDEIDYSTTRYSLNYQPYNGSEGHAYTFPLEEFTASILSSSEHNYIFKRISDLKWPNFYSSDFGTRIKEGLLDNSNYLNSNTDSFIKRVEIVRSDGITGFWVSSSYWTEGNYSVRSFDFYRGGGFGRVESGLSDLGGLTLLYSIMLKQSGMSMQITGSASLVEPDYWNDFTSFRYSVNSTNLSYPFTWFAQQLQGTPEEIIYFSTASTYTIS